MSRHECERQQPDQVPGQACHGCVVRPDVSVASPVDGLVGVGEALLEGGEEGLHLEAAVADHPQGSALGLHGPAGDELLVEGGEAEEVAELAGDVGVLAEQDAGVGEVEEVLGDLGGLAAVVAGRERVGGFVVGDDLDVAVVAGQAEAGVEGLDGVDAEAGLHPGFVAEHDPPVAGGGELAHALAPAVEAHQGDADGGFVAVAVEGAQGEGLDGGAPVGVEGGGGVEEAGELAFAEDAEGVAEAAGGVVEVAAGVVAAVGDELVGGLVEAWPRAGAG